MSVGSHWYSGGARQALAYHAFQVATEERLLEHRYRKGCGHKAQLNMGDCFAYACAKSLGVGLLYKGNDFAATDLA